MGSQISEETSKRITALRFLLIVFVVFIHNNFTAESIAESVANGGPEILFNQSVFGAWVQLFVSQGIARCAVPLFFLFAAYLQAKKDDPYPVLLKKRAKSLLLPFVLWTAVYAFYFAGLKLIVLKIAPQFIAHPEDTALSWTGWDWFHKILGYGLDEKGNIAMPGFAYHFWFLRDLIILVVLSPLLRFLIRRFPVGFFALVSIAFFLPVQIYFVASQALFFYVAGLYWGMYDVPLFEIIDRIKWKELVALFLLSFFGKELFYSGGGTLYWCMVLFASAFFLKVSGKIIQSERTFSVASYLAGFSFFLFAVHTPVLNEFVKKLWISVFPMRNSFYCLFEYFGASFVTICAGTGIGIVLKKVCPPLFRVFNGGRG